MRIFSEIEDFSMPGKTFVSLKAAGINV